MRKEVTTDLAPHELRPTPDGGTHLIIEETQGGPAARLMAPAMRGALYRQHQI